ncbi:MAG: cytidylate kinase-like family protein [Lachnospiraceae bacterium]|nr:cytidylate kinase-like family protein [Lachnospiraceae bacterium]
MLPVITISREAGSNGHKIGELVAKELNIPIIDKFVIDDDKDNSGVSPYESERKGQFLMQYDLFTNSKYYNGLDLEDDQSDMYHIQRKIILEEAKKGPCVIIGRCADAILNEESIESLNVFIHADMDTRVKNIHEKYPETRTPIEKLLKRQDTRRASYYSFNTEREWGAAENYDLVLNSSTLGEEFCADIIVETARKMDR